jgi:outer membrane protein OmpA-like peptidoglycan-associated protein
MLVKGDTLYEKQEFNKSLAYYNQVAGGQNKPELEVLNGQFTNMVKQGQMENAEHVYIKLLKTSMSETNEVANKIIFAPNATVPLESYANLYKIYLRQIANLVAASPACRVQIIGHSSRSGSASYNDKLSMQRAEWIKHQMAGYSPKSSARAQTIGRGFNENIVGSGKDDITDAIDRRVEFKFNNCEVSEEITISTTGVKKEASEVDPAPEVAAPKPLEVDDIEFFLKNKVSSKLIASRIAERGVNFELDDKISKRLKKLKAGNQVFKAIDEANRKNK